MPSRPQRVTNGHRAAVCGLVILGLGMIEACEIAGAPYQLVKASLPPNWHKRSRFASRWRGDELAGMLAAFVDPDQKTQTIADRYGVTADMIRRVAGRHGYKRPKGHPRGKNSVRTMTSKQRTIYFKLRHIMPAAAAAIEACRS